MDSKKKLSLITVNYRTESKVRALCASLERFPPSREWELLVVDNNSGTKRFETLQQSLAELEHVHVIGLSENIGFGRGNEEGLRFADGEIVTFINPDIEVLDGTLDILLDVLESDKQIGLVTPLLTSHSGTLLKNTWAFPSLWSLLRKRLFKSTPPKISLTKPFPVPWAQGSFLMMRRAVFDSLGGFDHRFFLFLEDTDLCRRVWASGKRILHVPRAKAIHEEKRLSGEGLFTSMKKKTFWIHVVSAIKYFWKWRGKKKPKIF